MASGRTRVNPTNLEERKDSEGLPNNPGSSQRPLVCARVNPTTTDEPKKGHTQVNLTNPDEPNNPQGPLKRTQRPRMNPMAPRACIVNPKTNDEPKDLKGVRQHTQRQQGARK